MPISSTCWVHILAESTFIWPCCRVNAPSMFFLSQEDFSLFCNIKLWTFGIKVLFNIWMKSLGSRWNYIKKERQNWETANISFSENNGDTCLAVMDKLVLKWEIMVKRDNAVDGSDITRNAILGIWNRFKPRLCSKILLLASAQEALYRKRNK